MPLLACSNVKYTIGTRVLLDGVALSVEPGQRIGLVGRNGCGKSTLLKVLSGRIRPDSGSISQQKGARIGYLTQDPELDHDKTLRAEALAGFAELNRKHAELEEVFHLMAQPENASGVALERLLKRQEDLQHEVDALGGYDVDHKMEAVLHGLGFTDAQFNIPVGKLSGGQKGRLALAKLLLESPDLLLLDEPTNHLDIAGREWLEEFLVNDFKGAVIMISHDRYMLDRVVQGIEELEAGRLIDYPGNYTAFLEIRKQRLLTQMRAYENQQSEWAKEEEFIRRFRAGQRAKEAQGRLSKLERQKELFAIARPTELATMRFSFPQGPRPGDHVVTVRDASKAYSNPVHQEGEDTLGDGEAPARKVLFNDLNVTISRGEHWGVIGPNGAGKSTLIKAILGQIPLDSGKTVVGASVVIGYYAQLPPEEDGTMKVIEYLQRLIRRENPQITFSEQAARDLAGAFLFTGDDQEKPIGVMSGGERSRARLAGLLSSAKNLLVLDEPTNHLDIPSSERLEQALMADEENGGYAGTLILISHDRAFIDATCQHLIVLDGKGGATVFHGNYSDWHAKQISQAAQKKREDDEKAKRKPTPASPAPAPKPKTAEPAPNADNGASKPAAAKKERAKTKLSWMNDERLEAEIARVSAKCKQLDDQLASEDVYRDARKFQALLKERDEVGAELAKFEEEWLLRSE
jgi:ATP-binding cassette subfamily F protein 3